MTDQSSILRFIEDNWLSGDRIQPLGSFDTITGPLKNMLDFTRMRRDNPRTLILDPVTSSKGH